MESNDRLAAARFLVGDVYFFVTYCDTRMRYPVVESYIYLGYCLSDDDDEGTWYFQPAADYVRNGSALEGSERPVFCATKSEVSEFVDEDELYVILKKSSDLRSGRE